MTESARLRLLAVTCEVCSRFLGPGTSLTPGQRVRHAAKQTLVLDLLSVPLSLRLPGLFFGSAGPCLLCRFLLGVSLPLLRPTFLLLGLVAGECAEGFFGLALDLVVHSYTSPSTALQDVRLLVRGADHVPDGDAALGSGALHLGEVHAQLLSLLLGGLRSVGLLLSALLLATLLLAAAGLLGSLARRLLPLLGCLTGGLLSLLSCLTDGLLSLLSCLTGRVLRLLGRLPRLVGRLTCDLSGLIGCLTGSLLGLVGSLAGRVLRLTGDLPDLIGHPLEGTSASPVLAATSNSANGFLSLACDLSRLVGRLTCDLSGLIGCLTGSLLGLVGSLARDLLSLVGRLPGGLLRLLGPTLRKLLHLLLGLLDSLVRYLHDALLLSRLIHRVFEFQVGVDHLLDLGLRVALGELLRVLLQLGAVVPDLAPEAAHGPPVEVLGVLHRLLLQLLLKILLLCHFVSFVLADLRSW